MRTESEQEVRHGHVRRLWTQQRLRGARVLLLAVLLFSIGSVGIIAHGAQAGGGGVRVANASVPKAVLMSGCGGYLQPPCTPVPTNTPTVTPTPTDTPTATPTTDPTPVSTGTTVIAQGNVDASGGVITGTMSTGNTISVSFPPGAVSTTVTVTVATYDSPPFPAPDGEGVVGLDFILSAVDASGNPVTTFNGEDVTVTFGYPANLDPNKTIFSYYDTTSDSWLPLTIVSIDTTNLLITATTTHFTAFSFVALPTAPYCDDPQHTDAFRATGDIDGNGTVNQFDLSEFSHDWLRSTSDPALDSPYSDMDCNNQVNQFDLSTFSNVWLKTSSNYP